MLIEREVSILPISIATALAIEGLFNLNPEEPKEFKYNKESIWINIRTLYRNLISSILPEVEYTDDMVVDDLKEEIKILLTILKENGVDVKNKVTLYANSQDDIYKVFPYALIKKPKTDKQKESFKREKSITNTLLDDLKEETEINDTDYILKIADHILTGENQNAIVLTNHPIDLLSRYKFSELKLLESHTGNIKLQNQWNTKLTGGSKNPRIPFNSFTLQVFGDNSTHFYSRPLAYKRALIELAKISDWNSLTGTEKIIRDLAKIKASSPWLFQLFEKLLKTKMFF